jgi:hypothetical protein
MYSNANRRLLLYKGCAVLALQPTVVKIDPLPPHHASAYRGVSHKILEKTHE